MGLRVVVQGLGARGQLPAIWASREWTRWKNFAKKAAMSLSSPAFERAATNSRQGFPSSCREPRVEDLG